MLTIVLVDEPELCTFELPTADRTLRPPTTEELHQAAKSGDMWLLRRWMEHLSPACVVAVAERLPQHDYESFFTMVAEQKNLDGQELLLLTLTSSHAYDILREPLLASTRPLASLIRIAIQHGGRFPDIQRGYISIHAGLHGGALDFNEPNSQNLVADDEGHVATPLAMMSDPTLDIDIINRCLNQAILGGSRKGHQRELILGILKMRPTRAYIPAVDLADYVNYDADLVGLLTPLAQ